MQKSGVPQRPWSGETHPSFSGKKRAESVAVSVNTEPDSRIEEVLAGITHVEKEPVGESMFMWQAIFRDAFTKIISNRNRNASPIPGCSGDPEEHTLPSGSAWEIYLNQATYEQWQQLQGGNAD